MTLTYSSHDGDRRGAKERTATPIPAIPASLLRRWHRMVQCGVDSAGVDAVWISRVDSGRAELLTMATGADRCFGEDVQLVRGTQIFRDRIVDAHVTIAVIDAKSWPGPPPSDAAGCPMAAYLALPIFGPGGALFGTIEATCRAETSWAGAKRRLFALLRDTAEDHLTQLVSDEIRAQQDAELALEHERLSLAATVGHIGIWDYHLHQDRLYCDPRWYAIVGRDPADPVRSIGDWQPHIHPEDRGLMTAARAATLTELRSTGQPYQRTFRIVRPDGEIRWLASTAHFIAATASSPDRLVGFVTDVTERRLAEDKLIDQQQELERLSLCDPLTDIANRRQFDLAFDRACRQVTKEGSRLGFAIVDVDCFKQYNDSYGHHAGDAALRAVAQTLFRLADGPGDLVARYGGEEFVLILPDPADFPAMLERMRKGVEALGIMHRLSWTSSVVTISMGGVLVDRGQCAERQTLLERADAALYEAKSSGRNRVVTVPNEPEMRLLKLG